VVPVSLDDDGPLPSEVRAAQDHGVRALFLQPRAQNPTGASLTPTRIATLARILARSEVIIVEDDSAGAVAATPPVSLGARLPDRTVHVRSYSKSHGPDLRLAAVGGPSALIDPVVERRFLGQGWTSRLLQALLVDLLTHGPSVRAVEHARRVYARRRALVLDALAANGIEVRGKDGLNIWLPVADENAALLRLAAGGIGASAGRPFHAGPARDPGAEPHLRVTVGLARTAHRQLADVLASAARLSAHSAPR
jgi:DNA-binding transcriptional MocR family regulator